MKECSKCKESKDISEYYNDKRQKHGKSPSCKRCKNKQNKERKESVVHRNYKKHSVLDSALWRNFLIPVSIGGSIGLLFKLVCVYMGWNQFLAGWFSCTCFFIAHKISSIEE